MLKPWNWGRASHRTAVANAREAATQLSRQRLEREGVELYLAQRHDAGVAAGVPRPA